jgi:hypothetical protein
MARIGRASSNARMDAVPRLRLEPRPSRRAAVAFTLAAIVTTGVVLALPLGVAGRLAALAAAVVAIDARLRALHRGVPALIHLGLDRRIAVTRRDGRTVEGRVLPASYVGARVVSLVWCPDGWPWWRPAPALLLLPDMVGADDHRQLRVVLRYGRAPAAGERPGSDESAADAIAAPGPAAPATPAPAERAISGAAWS